MRTFLIGFLFHALRSVHGGRDASENHSLAVDLAANFHERGLRSVLESNGTDAIERLGHEIAKSLVHELRGRDEGGGDGGDSGAAGAVQARPKDDIEAALQLEKISNKKPPPVDKLEASMARAAITPVVQPTGLLQRLDSSEHLDNTSRRARQNDALPRRPKASSLVQRLRARRTRPKKRMDAVSQELLSLKTMMALDKAARDRSQFTRAFEMFHATKADKGCVDFDLLDSKLHSPKQGSISEVEFLQVCQKSEVFKQIDRDGTGKIDKEEYEKACEDSIIGGDDVDLSRIGNNAVRLHGSVFAAALLLLVRI
jgi:hypothetical protein